MINNEPVWPYPIDRGDVESLIRDHLRDGRKHIGGGLDSSGSYILHVAAALQWCLAQMDAPAQPPAQSQACEPVAWRYKNYLPWLDGGFAWGLTAFPSEHAGFECEPLYTHPPAPTLVEAGKSCYEALILQRKLHAHDLRHPADKLLDPQIDKLTVFTIADKALAAYTAALDAAGRGEE